MIDDLHEHVADALETLSWIKWDRYVTGSGLTTHDSRFYAEVYGWIEREDEHADFVVLTVFGDGEIGHVTSSPMADKRINKELYGAPADAGNECQRVEDEFDAPNMVELGAEA